MSNTPRAALGTKQKLTDEMRWYLKEHGLEGLIDR